MSAHPPSFLPGYLLLSILRPSARIAVPFRRVPILTDSNPLSIPKSKASFLSRLCSLDGAVPAPARAQVIHAILLDEFMHAMGEERRRQREAKFDSSYMTAEKLDSPLDPLLAVRQRARSPCLGPSGPCGVKPKARLADPVLTACGTAGSRGRQTRTDGSRGRQTRDCWFTRQANAVTFAHRTFDGGVLRG